MANVKPIRTFLTTFLFIPFFSVSAQDISGIWQGVSYITGGTSYYVCTMTLQQNGPNVTGTALTKEVIPRGYYVIQSVAGTVSNNVFNFADQAIIERRDQSSFNWCMRYGPLTYNQPLEKLSGIAQTVNCTPSTITMELYRLKVFADTTLCNPQNVPIRATGQNLRWYKDSTKQTLIYTGNNINPYVTRDTVFYVTQTLYNTESPVVAIAISMKAYLLTKNIAICDGQSITVGDTTYRTSGSYIKRYTRTNGCDSIITTNITVNTAPKVTQTLKRCSGQSLTVGDTTYRTSGTYIKKLTTRNGCDSTITTNLTVSPIYAIQRTLSICEGASLTQGDTTYRTSGIYLKILKTTEGCDSAITTNLTVNPIKRTTQSFKICTGESISVGDTTYRTTGQYTKRLTAFGGCDILVTSNVLVNTPKQTNQAFTICSSQSIIVGDTIYRTAGTYLKKLKTTEGCDSVVTTQLTIQNEVTFNQKFKICEGASIAVGDTMYKTNGIFIKKLRSASGCDSVITTDVTVIKFDIITSNDTLINLGDSIRLSASINPPLSVSWKWTPTNTVRCDTCPTTWAKPNTTTQYQVEILEKENKCRKTSRITVRTKSGCDIYIPTAFSPNGDNVNDKFALYPSACLKRIKRFAVFNRWGNLIIARNDIAAANNQSIDLWDGTMNGNALDTGTFVYVVEAEYINGQSEVLSGDFSIVK